MKITAEILSKITGKPVNSNMRSVVAGLEMTGDKGQLNKPEIVAHYIAQTAHESMGFVHDREIWGPTDAQRRYEGRADLGNTQKGDGYLYRGRSPIQLTGRYNYTQFYNWARANFQNVPDLVKNPDLINTDPWEGVVPAWYWTTHNLAVYAAKNDIEMVTRRINGGLNGFNDRLRWYTRTALVLLGYDPEDIRGFQTANNLKVDGISGPATRAKLHQMLSLVPVETKPDKEEDYRKALMEIKAILDKLEL